MNRIGLLFGSFNPVHNGHIAIAKAGFETAGASEVWFVLQERNKFKPENTLAPLEDRLAMLRLVTNQNPDFKLVVSGASSMLEGLLHLKKNYAKQFVLLMGQDLVASLPSWNDSDQLINRYPIYAYRRDNGISSEAIREQIASKGSNSRVLDPKVVEYIRSHNLYTVTA